MLKNMLQRTLIRCLFSTQAKQIQAPRKYSEPYSKARVIMHLYKLKAKSASDIFLAPNATIAGQVYFGCKIVVGHGAVIRGDINSIYIHKHVVIGDNCVLHTAASLPNGLPAHLSIGVNVIVSPGSTLYSCKIQDKVFIGQNTVILQGAKIQTGAIILPNSVVPPGRVVPANQVWGGNPIKFIRYAKQQQGFVTKNYSEYSYDLTELYVREFLPYNNAYLYKPSDPQNDKIRSMHVLSYIDEHDLEGNYDPNQPTV